jgi:hypothetical protein
MEVYGMLGCSSGKTHCKPSLRASRKRTEHARVGRTA